MVASLGLTEIGFVGSRMFLRLVRFTFSEGRGQRRLATPPGDVDPISELRDDLTIGDKFDLALDDIGSNGLSVVITARGWRARF